jgi:hypothetical protein
MAPQPSCQGVKQSPGRQTCALDLHLGLHAAGQAWTPAMGCMRPGMLPSEPKHCVPDGHARP